MFKIMTAASLSLAIAAGPALAGGLAPAVQSEPIVIDEAEVAPRASTGVLVPLLLLGALAVVLAASDDDDDDDDKEDGGTGGDGGEEPPTDGGGEEPPTDGGEEPPPDEGEEPPKENPGKDWPAYCASHPAYDGPEC
jgi:hypothetical protein